MAEQQDTSDRKKQIVALGTVAALVSVGFAVVNAVNTSQRNERSQFLSDLAAGNLRSAQGLDLLNDRCGSVLTGAATADATVKDICEDMALSLTEFMSSTDRDMLETNYTSEFLDAVYAITESADSNMAGDSL